MVTVEPGMPVAGEKPVTTGCAKAMIPGKKHPKNTTNRKTVTGSQCPDCWSLSCVFCAAKRGAGSRQSTDDFFIFVRFLGVDLRLLQTQTLLL
jgi:hypothetical protein